MILIYTHNSADDNGGKYQKVNTSANAICKYVTGFSFIAGFANVTSGCHNTPMQKYSYQSYCYDIYISHHTEQRPQDDFLYKNLTIDYFLAHSSTALLKLLISFR